MHLVEGRRGQPHAEKEEEGQDGEGRPRLAHRNDLAKRVLLDRSLPDLDRLRRAKKRVVVQLTAGGVDARAPLAACEATAAEVLFVLVLTAAPVVIVVPLRCDLGTLLTSAEPLAVGLGPVGGAGGVLRELARRRRAHDLALARLNATTLVIGGHGRDLGLLRLERGLLCANGLNVVLRVLHNRIAIGVKRHVVDDGRVRIAAALFHLVAPHLLLELGGAFRSLLCVVISAQVYIEKGGCTALQAARREVRAPQLLRVLKAERELRHVADKFGRVRMQGRQARDASLVAQGRAPNAVGKRVPRKPGRPDVPADDGPRQAQQEAEVERRAVDEEARNEAVGHQVLHAKADAREGPVEAVVNRVEAQYDDSVGEEDAPGQQQAQAADALGDERVHAEQRHRTVSKFELRRWRRPRKGVDLCAKQ